MDILTQIPIGTKFKVKETGELVTLEEIRNFPTRYKVKTPSGQINYYKTHEIEVIKFSSFKISAIRKHMSFSSSIIKTFDFIKY